MVVSMDCNQTIDVTQSTCHEEGYTGISAAVSTANISSCRNNYRTSSDMPMPISEADTTNGNHYLMKEGNNEGEHVKVMSGSMGGEDLFGKHIKDLIGLQLDLIEYQQMKIVNKDKQIMMLKSEKEQLEARICRMERRIALQKKQYDPEDSSIPKIKTSIPTKNSGSKSEVQKYEQLLPVTISSRADREFKFNTYLKTNCNYLDLSGSKLLPNVDPVKVKEKPTKTEYVSVPSWKTINRPTGVAKEATEEEITNEAFRKRHTKPELEEKRRKRWDLQHLRQQHQQQMLSRKNEDNKNEGKTVLTNNDHNFASLYPMADNAMAIEISNTVPVCVFGYPAPAVATRELELPWFNIAKREIQLRQAKEKSMKKHTKGYVSAKKKHTKLKSCR